jgi:hypothetical protein
MRLGQLLGLEPSTITWPLSQPSDQITQNTLVDINCTWSLATDPLGIRIEERW